MFNLQFSHIDQILAKGNYSSFLKVSQFYFVVRKKISNKIIKQINEVPCLASALMPSNFSQASFCAVSATGMSRFFARARSKLRFADS